VRLDAKQDAILNRIRAKNRAWRNAKADAIPRGKALVEAEIADYLLELDLELRQGLEAGIPKSRLYQDGLGTKSSSALEESLERTATIARTLAAQGDDDLGDGRYRWGSSGLLAVTLDGLEFDAACAALGWSADVASRLGLDSAQFRVGTRAYDGVTRFLDPQVADWLPEHGNRHPIVTWAQTDAHESEAIDWVNANPPPAGLTSDVQVGASNG
jgi:hypothetical protein